MLYWETSPWPGQHQLITHIALALQARGAQAHAVICDGTPIACLDRTAAQKRPLETWPQACLRCYAACRNECAMFALQPKGLGDFLSESDVRRLRKTAHEEVPLDAIRKYRYRGLPVGAAAYSSTLRYYQREGPFEESILREYLASALLTAEAGIRAVDRIRPDALLMTHGIYSTWGPVTEYAARKGIPVVVLLGGYETCFVYLRKLRQGDGLNLNAGAIGRDEWETLARGGLDERQEALLDRWFARRYTRGGKFRVIHNAPHGDRLRTLKELGLSPEQPVWAIFTNLYWDGSIDEAPTAFADTSEWIRCTLEKACSKKDVQWMVKIHPSEDLPDMEGGVTIRALIDASFPTLPDHIRVLPASSPINPWDFYHAIDGGVVFMGNTVGLELASLGKPVINAGYTVGSHRGFSRDALTPERYLALLDEIPNIPPLSQEERLRARTFAYHYFLRLHIPLPPFRLRTSDENFQTFRWDLLDLLRPGRHPVYDMICERFFGDEAFLLPEEVVEAMTRYWDISYANFGQLEDYAPAVSARALRSPRTPVAGAR